MGAAVPWDQFAVARPDLAEAGRELFYQYGVGRAFLSTVRADGGPRLHPICPVLVEGKLVAHIIPSRKRDDLDRDGRYALHAFPVPANEDAFYLTGTASQVRDEEFARRASAQFQAEREYPAEPPEFATGWFYEFLVGQCLLTRTTGHDDWTPQHSTWVAP